MNELDQPQVVEYYTVAGPVLADHLDITDQVARGWGPSQSMPGGGSGGRAVAEAVAGGARWFTWTVGASTPQTVAVTPGDGTDVATAATAALSLIETVLVMGGAAVPATDGEDGLLIYVTGCPDLSAIVHALTTRAPEVATSDAANAEGRALVSMASEGSSVPVPYSLVDSADGTGVVFPLTLDEVAAVAAGMPLQPIPGDLAGRLELHGDLAAPLHSR